MLAGLQDRGEFDQPGLVLVGVVLAEEELRSGRQLGANAGRSPTAVAPIRSRQIRTCQSCSHDLSVLACLHSLMTFGGFRLVPELLWGVSFLTGRLVRAQLAV